MSDISEAELVQALEASPKVHVPWDFTQRVMKQLPANGVYGFRRLPALPRNQPGFGRMALLLAFVLLLLGMVLVPLLLSKTILSFALDSLLFVNLSCLVLYTVWQRLDA